MYEEELDINEKVGTDFVMNILLLFVALAILMISWIAEAKMKETEDQKPQGDVVFEIYWGNNLNSDVDLWVQAPNDVAVGFPHLGGRYANLLRDDLGGTQDVTPINAEIAYTRGMPDGEYVMNIHWYNRKDVHTPLPVKAVVTVRSHPSDRNQDFVMVKDLILERLEQELTVVRFTVKDKKVLKESINNRYKGLYATGGR